MIKLFTSSNAVVEGCISNLSLCFPFFPPDIFHLITTSEMIILVTRAKETTGIHYMWTTTKQGARVTWAELTAGAAGGCVDHLLLIFSRQAVAKDTALMPSHLSVKYPCTIWQTSQTIRHLTDEFSTVTSACLFRGRMLIAAKAGTGCNYTVCMSGECRKKSCISSI